MPDVIYRQLEGILKEIPFNGEVKFDGGQNPDYWSAWGFPRNIIPDQYVESCKGGAINLHFFRLGDYPGCNECSYTKECLRTSRVSFEQAEL